MKKYRTKYGLELIAFIFLVFASFIFVPHENAADLDLLLIPVILFFLFVFSGIKYSVDQKDLTVHSSFFSRNKIPVSAIRKIRETNNPLSSPTASLDRLEIFYNKFDSIIISPVRTEEFLKNLLAINPKIEVIRKPKRNIFSKLAL